MPTAVDWLAADSRQSSKTCEANSRCYWLVRLYLNNGISDLVANFELYTFHPSLDRNAKIHSFDVFREPFKEIEFSLSELQKTAAGPGWAGH